MNTDLTWACPSNDKQALRRELLALRNTIAPEDKQDWDRAINRAVMTHEWFRRSQTILSYFPIGSEPDTKLALEEALRQGKRIYLPKCNPRIQEMTFHRITSLEGLKSEAHGIPEPEANNSAFSIHNSALCLVPGVAFDRAGFRLGYGGGYYDRFLARQDGLRTLGVCYGILLRATLPRDAMDIAVERVITEGEEHEREPE